MLSDYEIAQTFGATLSLIYKEKVGELNDDLEPIYAHLDRLDLPKYTDWERQMALDFLPTWAREKLQAISHINKIRNIYKKIKKTPEGEGLNIEKAKLVPIESLYNFEKRKKDMICCPFHIDNSPSMKINKNNTVKCFSCGFFGDSIKFFMKLNSLGFKEAVEQLEKM